jgi:hypothetical protein
MLERRRIACRIRLYQGSAGDALACDGQHVIGDIQAYSLPEMRFHVRQYPARPARKVEITSPLRHVLLHDLIEEQLLALPHGSIERTGREQFGVVILCPGLSSHVTRSVVLELHHAAGSGARSSVRYNRLWRSQRAVNVEPR